MLSYFQSCYNILIYRLKAQSFLPINRNAISSRANALKYESLYFDIEIIKKDLAKMTDLKYVLICLDYHSLYFTREPLRDFLYSYYYDIKYMDQPPSLKKRISLLYGYGFRDGITMLRNKPTKTVKGWAGWQTTNYDSLNELTGKGRGKYFNAIIRGNISEKNEIISNLCLFIKQLEDHDVVPILLTLPCHDFFNRNLDSSVLAQN